jgi:hypothetical protein
MIGSLPNSSAPSFASDLSDVARAKAEGITPKCTVITCIDEAADPIRFASTISQRADISSGSRMAPVDQARLVIRTVFALHNPGPPRDKDLGPHEARAMQATRKELVGVSSK